MVENKKEKNGIKITLKNKLILTGLVSILIPFFIVGTIIYFQLSNE